MAGQAAIIFHLDAMDYPESYLLSLFEGKAFESYKKQRESEHNVQMAMIKRLDALIKRKYPV